MMQPDESKVNYKLVYSLAVIDCDCVFVHQISLFFSCNKFRF